MSYNPITRWAKSPNSPSVTRYDLAWSLNGSPAGTISIPQSAAGDISSYNSSWSAANPAVVLAAGNVVGASLTAVDATNSLSSTPVVAPALTIPATAPSPPANVSLSLS